MDEHRLLRWACAGLGLLGGTVVTAGGVQPAGRLSALLEAELSRFPGSTGVYVKHLATGEEAAVRADEAFNSASVIKLPVMTLAYELSDQGALDLSRRVERTSPPVVANDVGLIYARSGAIVVSFFAMRIEGSYAEAEDRIGRVARLIVDFFDGAP